jgi:hypothetical protein
VGDFVSHRGIGLAILIFVCITTVEHKNRSVIDNENQVS